MAEEAHKSKLPYCFTVPWRDVADWRTPHSETKAERAIPVQLQWRWGTYSREWRKKCCTSWCHLWVTVAWSFQDRYVSNNYQGWKMFKVLRWLPLADQFQHNWELSFVFFMPLLSYSLAISLRSLNGVRRTKTSKNLWSFLNWSTWSECDLTLWSPQLELRFDSVVWL